LHNPDFKGIEFDAFKNEAGSNSFTLTPKKWTTSTNAIGIISKSGRYGGTYAHQDIAFEFVRPHTGYKYPEVQLQQVHLIMNTGRAVKTGSGEVLILTIFNFNPNPLKL